MEFLSHVPIHLMPTAANDTLHAIPRLIKFKRDLIIILAKQLNHDRLIMVPMSGNHHGWPEKDSFTGPTRRT